MKKTVNILLVLRSGGDFGMRDVRVLSNHLLSSLNGEELKVWCLTDLVKEKTVSVNVTFLPIENRWRGWWSKMNLFSPKLEHLRPFMYMDLDTALLKPVSCVLPADHIQSNVIMLRDFYKARRAASGVMWIPANNGKVAQIWKAWINNPEGHMRRFRGDQEFIGSVTIPDFYWQDITKGIVSFKPGKKKRVELEGNERVVCFHGKPRPREAAKYIDWVKEYMKGEL